MGISMASQPVGKKLFNHNSDPVLSFHTRKRWGNAQVTVKTDEEGQKWVVKDFRPCSWMVRNFISRFVIATEVRALRRLQHVDGIPGPVEIIGRWTFAYPFVDGLTLRDVRTQGIKLAKSYFESLEFLVLEMHKSGVAHLDLRNRRNILVVEGDKPVLLDFGTAISVKYLPRFIRRLLCSVDLAGAYKHWNKLSPETISPERKQTLYKIRSLDRFWVFRGYPLQKLSHKARRERAKSNEKLVKL